MLVRPFKALMEWICITGNKEGYLLCAVGSNNMIKTDQFWSAKEFTGFFRERLCNSRKRCCVQLYISFGIRDENIMER